jgi:hypothetical protein
MRTRRSRWTGVLAGLAVQAVTARGDGETHLPKLSYVPGGHVIEHVKVVPVLWSAGVVAETRAGVAPFYRALVVSSFFDFLNEYSTVRGSLGTGQDIGTGTSLDPITLVPLNPDTQLTDVDLQAELAAQIAAGALPAPDADTIYMLHFPPGFNLNEGGDDDCSQPGGTWCAYHSSGTAAALHYRYAVMPDTSEGDCRACNEGLSPFEGVTISASHELFEAITEPDLVLLRKRGWKYLSWIDDTAADPASEHGEIGDICERDSTHPLIDDAVSIDGTGGPFTVQREWSNQYQACIASKEDVFPVTFSPTRLSAAPGSTATLTATVGLPARATSAPVTIRVLGLTPDGGITAAVSPETLQPGQTAQISLQVDAAAPAISSAFMVLTSGARATVFKALLLSVAPDGLRLALQSSELRVTAGASTQVQVDTASFGNPKQVDLSTTGLPDGVVASFDPPTVSGGASSTLTLTADRKARGGTALPFSVVATSGAFSASSGATLTVDSAGCASAGGGPWLLLALLLPALRRRPSR